MPDPLRQREGRRKDYIINAHDSTIAEQMADVASVLQLERTGHAPSAVTVILSADTLVVTLYDALSPAERALAESPAGAAQVQEFHRQLFSSCNEEMRGEIKRITGRDVIEAAVKIEVAMGTVVHAFTSGAMVQVFLLKSAENREPRTSGDSRQPADDDGLCITRDAEFQAGTSL